MFWSAKRFFIFFNLLIRNYWSKFTEILGIRKEHEKEPKPLFMRKYFSEIHSCVQYRSVYYSTLDTRICTVCYLNLCTRVWFDYNKKNYFLFFRFVLSYFVYEHVTYLLPYISDAGTLPPESCYFGQCLNILWVLGKYNLYFIKIFRFN